MKLTQDVLQALSRAETTGTHLRLVGQFDRPLYLKVNKALEAIGGKWNRKLKAHLFDGDAADRVDEALLSGEVATAKDIGFFPTPPEVGATLCAAAFLDPGMTVLEPSAGDGSLAQAILNACHPARLTLVERDERLAAKAADRFGNDDRVAVSHADFFSWRPELPEFDRVIMNPPFIRERDGGVIRTHLDHVRRAFGMLRAGGRLVSVLPSSVEFREDRAHVGFRNWFEACGATYQKLPPEAFRSAGTLVQTVAVAVTKP